MKKIPRNIFIISAIGISIVVLIWAVAGAKHAGKKKDAPSPTVSSEAPADPGLVVIPADSPKLEQIKVEPVQLAEMPVDEVTVPGKIEANPLRISHVLLPTAGRIV